MTRGDYPIKAGLPSACQPHGQPAGHDGHEVALRPRFSRRAPGYPARVPPVQRCCHGRSGKFRETRRIVSVLGLAAGRRQMAGYLRIHADVVERAGQDRDDDGPGMRTALIGRAVVTTLTSRYGPDDQPYQHNDASGSHMYLRKKGRSSHWNEPRTRVVLASTLTSADMRPEGNQYAACGAPRDTDAFPADRVERRCILAADGLGCEDRGRRSSRRAALPRAWWRRPAVFAVTR